MYSTPWQFSKKVIKCGSQLLSNIYKAIQTVRKNLRRISYLCLQLTPTFLSLLHETVPKILI